MTRLKLWHRGISNHIIFPISLMMILQMALILFTIDMGVTFATINQTTVTNFQSEVDVHSNYIETSMIDSWCNLEADSKAISASIGQLLGKEQMTAQDFLQNKNLQMSILQEVYNDIFVILRRNKVTGTYIALENTFETTSNLGIYLRDHNPGITNSSNKDVLIEVAPTEVREKCLEMGFDSPYSYETRFSNIKEEAFYKQVITVGQDYPTVDVKYLGYWSDNMNVHDSEEIAYSIPIKYENVVLGVLGVSISKTYLESRFGTLISSIDETLKNLAILKKVNDVYTVVVYSYQDRNLKNHLEYKAVPSKFQDLYVIEGTDYYLSLNQANVYANNTPFSNEEWYVAGMTLKSDLFARNSTIMRQILLTCLFSLVIGLICLFIICKWITKPISRLTKNLSVEGLSGKKTNIYEIDILVEELRKYIDKSIKIPSKISSIFEMASIKIAAFEYDETMDVVSVTEQFYSLLNVASQGVNLTLQQFKDLISILEDFDKIVEKEEGEYFIESTKTWIRAKFLAVKDGFIGIIIDITKEVDDKLELEIERDHDALTGLLNRRGFLARVQEIWAGPIKESLLLMIDLDNLKHINDKYGHNFGDDYIRRLASVLHDIAEHDKILTCHISGDEFLVFFYEWESKDMILAYVEDFKRRISETYLDIYGQKIYIKLSCGMVFYDESIKTFNEYRKYADFAMYDIKKKTKSGFNFFSLEKYLKSSKDFELSEKFIAMIETNQISYHFQPIVDARTGDILGYEALMRPQVEEFYSLTVVLELAHKLDMLQQIEELTFFNACTIFQKTKSDKKIFINSISNQIMSEDKFEVFKQSFSSLSPQIVVEIIEEERLNPKIMNTKKIWIAETGAELALDDYGTGYNSISTIMTIAPKYIKLEGSFVREIDKQINQQKLAKTMIDYCHVNGILVIAESIETQEELDTLLSLDVDFLQGFFIGEPRADLYEIRPTIRKHILDFQQK